MITKITLYSHSFYFFHVNYLPTFVESKVKILRKIVWQHKFDKRMRSDSSKYIHVIENTHKELMTSELSDNIGLHAGTSGIALFLVYYDSIILGKNDISQRVMEIQEHNIEQINSGSNLHAIFDGISGFGWLCEHLRKLGMLNRENIEFLDDLDLFLYKRIMVDIRQGNYDYLHGTLGVGTYFLSRFDNKAIPKYKEELLTKLEKLREPCENDVLKWLSVLNYETDEKGYNISLLHGMTSIAFFFVRLHQLKFEAERVGNLFIRTITYILVQVTYTEDSELYFPAYSKERNTGNFNIRLGWCYEDLGIAHILWQVAILLKNKEWEDTVIQILLYNSNWLDLQKNNIMDTGFCHGSAGVAHIFWNLYLSTRIQKCQEITDYWLNITMQMAKYTDGAAGFMAWRTKKIGGLVKSDSLLEGIADIRLVLLSHLNSN